MAATHFVVTKEIERSMQRISMAEFVGIESFVGESQLEMLDNRL